MTTPQQETDQQIHQIEDSAEAIRLLTEQSEECPDNLFVIGYFKPSSQLQQYFVEEVARKNVEKEKTLVFFTSQLAEDDKHVATIETYSEGEVMGEKSYESNEDLDEIRADISMFVMAEVMAHKYSGIAMLDEEEEDEDDEEEEEEVADEDDEEEDEDYVDEENEEEEDEEEMDEVGEEEDHPTTTITQADLQPVWAQILKDFDGDTLNYVTFRNSVSGLIRNLLFATNPVMKMMASISDPAAPERDDLLQLIEEAQSLPQESINEPIPEEVETLVKSTTDLKAKFKQQQDFSDEFQYFIHNDEQSDNAIQQHEQQQNTEWKVFGADLLRLHVGSTYSVGRGYRGQFRVNVDLGDNALEYTMFTFEADDVDQTTQRQMCEDKDICKQWIIDQSKQYLQSKCARIRVQLSDISAIQYHLSQVDPGLGLLVIDTAVRPQFAQRDVTSSNWQQSGDFTVDNSVSVSPRHFVLGYDIEMRNILALLLQSDSRLQTLYSEKPLYGKLTADSSTQFQGEIQSAPTLFENSNTRESTSGDAQAQKECILM